MEEVREVSLLIEGFDETKVEKETTVDKAIQSVIGAYQNNMFLTGRVISFETIPYGDKPHERKRVAIVKLLNDENNSVKGLLPMELSDETDKNRFRSLLGRKVNVMVEKYEEDEDGKLIFTANRQKAKELARDLTFRKVEKDDVITAVVQFVTNKAVFVDVGGITLSLGANSLTYDWLNDLQEHYKIGQHIKVKVMEIDKEKRKIVVSAKALLRNPWASALKEYPKNKEVIGEVTGVMNYGIFVKVEAGINVLCRNLRHESHKLSGGETVVVRIGSVDVEKQEMEGNIIRILNM